MNDLISKVISDIEKKEDKESWQPENKVFYAVGFARSIPGRSFWFWRHFQKQTDKSPRGLTRENAKKLAGVKGQVHRITISRERLH